jgi:hypothetical protein
MIQGHKTTQTYPSDGSSTQRRAENIRSENGNSVRRVQRSGPAAERIARRQDAEPCAMSFAQQRLWFLEQLEPGDPNYHVVHALRLKGRLDEQALRQSLKSIVERHDALRTTFGYQDQTPVQVVQPARDVELRSFDLRENPEDEAVNALLRVEARRPFDFSKDLMLRAVLGVGADVTVPLAAHRAVAIRDARRLAAQLVPHRSAQTAA